MDYKLMKKRTYLEYVTLQFIFNPKLQKVREDKKLDLILDKPGFTVFEDHTQRVLEYLKQHGGFSPINDKSSPEDIKRAFNMSKKAFKKSIGMLYKKRILEIKEDGIHLK